MKKSNESRRRFLGRTAFVTAGAMVLGINTVADATPTDPSIQRDTRSQGSRGTIIRGADGSLYYIPDRRLPAFRLPEAKAATLRSAISGDEPIKAVPNRILKRIGLVAGDDDETVVVLSLGAIRRLYK